MAVEVPRRALLTGALGFGAAALAGCGAPALTVPDHPATGRARSGGVLRIARPAASAAETLDSASSLSAYEYLGAIYNRVVRLDPQGQVIPDLATEWSSNAEATEWTFKLRDGVEFHNGKPFTARDVRYSIEHILNPDTASPQAGTLSSMFGPDGIEVPDDHTIRFRLLTANAEFPSLLTAISATSSPRAVPRRSGRRG